MYVQYNIDFEPIYKSKNLFAYIILVFFKF